MADPVKDLGLSCPDQGIFHAYPHAQNYSLGCCASGPCRDGSDVCPDGELLAATFDPLGLSPRDDTPPQDCLEGDWYACPGLKNPFVGCCLRDPCSARCPAEDLGTAALARDLEDVRKRAAYVENTDAEPTATAIDTSPTRLSSMSVSDTVFTSISETRAMPTATPTGLPASTTVIATLPEKTVMVPGPDPKDNLSEREELGVGLGTGIFGAILAGCIGHRIVVHVRKRRPGYSYRTDHDPDWRPPGPSPSTVGSDVGPRTRERTLSLVPGAATRPRSWEDEGNNEAEARLVGVPGRRRARSAEPAKVLDDVVFPGEAIELQKFSGGQLACAAVPWRHPPVCSIPLGLPRDSTTALPPDETESMGGRQDQEAWVSAHRHAEYHGDFRTANGDFVVDMEARDARVDRHPRHANNPPRPRPTHSADELRRLTAPYNPAARSVDQLGRFARAPRGGADRPDQRLAARSEGGGRLLGAENHHPRTASAQTLPPSAGTAGGARGSGEVHGLREEPVGEIRDPRARSTLGRLFVLNPDPEEGGEAEARLEDDGEGKGPAGDETPVSDESGTADGDKVEPVTDGDSEQAGQTAMKHVEEEEEDKKEEDKKEEDKKEEDKKEEEKEDEEEDEDNEDEEKDEDDEDEQDEEVQAQKSTQPDTPVEPEPPQVSGLPRSPPTESETIQAFGSVSPSDSVPAPERQTAQQAEAREPRAAAPSAPNLSTSEQPLRPDAVTGLLSRRLENGRPTSLTGPVSSASHLPQRPGTTCGLPSSSSAPVAAASHGPRQQRHEPQPRPQLRRDDVSQSLAAPFAQAPAHRSEMMPAHDGGMRHPDQLPTRPAAPGRSEVSLLARQERYRPSPSTQATAPGRHYVPVLRRDGQAAVARPSGLFQARHPTYPAAAATPRPSPSDDTPRHLSAPDPRAAPARQHPRAYAETHHTRVYYPHRAHPPRPLVPPPPPGTAERPRRSALRLGLGPQPRPAYRTFQGAVGLNEGGDIPRRDDFPRVPTHEPRRVPDGVVAGGARALSSSGVMEGEGVGGWAPGGRGEWGSREWWGVDGGEVRDMA